MCDYHYLEIHMQQPLGSEVRPRATLSPEPFCKCRAQQIRGRVCITAKPPRLSVRLSDGLCVGGRGKQGYWNREIGMERTRNDSLETQSWVWASSLILGLRGHLITWPVLDVMNWDGDEDAQKTPSSFQGWRITRILLDHTCWAAARWPLIWV